MLKRLNAKIDDYCGFLDIYKIETIGDAYVCAGGLHKPSVYHSQRIAWMGLLMMDTASKNVTNKGDPIKVNNIKLFSPFFIVCSKLKKNKKILNIRYVLEFTPVMS